MADLYDYAEHEYIPDGPDVETREALRFLMESLNDLAHGEVRWIGDGTEDDVEFFAGIAMDGLAVLEG